MNARKLYYNLERKIRYEHLTNKSCSFIVGITAFIEIYLIRLIRIN